MQAVREIQLDPFVEKAETFANQALNSGFAATFAYWVSTLNEQPSIDGARLSEPNWQRRIGAARPRPLGAAIGYKIPAGVHSTVSELSHQRLSDALLPQPLVLDASPNRLPIELIANLDWKTRQRRQRATLPKREPARRNNPSRLYDVLQSMGIEDQQPLM
ncbi:ribosomal S4p-like protein [Idiomarina fontislapidosi]|uniref:Uncharacterized protein n=1 Tax=Idiomarina fontislapidosi TaxID=263723 RepID=A0A432YBP2_9GAMM|nr:hypothetical protein [Idiomarina fontislapidosi]PYE35472.1 ribosomal S4p-like protein [Idiomarina fontislapidosi]RUO58353.1 hypothetical protein CWE25_01815 [Idiomarina fontislapidosi]|tara:strand:+ start:133 stop:615 length:483 start_codon:yes stop_codon:yes gene_type:complete